jgi:hypothetical protein
MVAATAVARLTVLVTRWWCCHCSAACCQQAVVTGLSQQAAEGSAGSSGCLSTQACAESL